MKNIASGKKANIKAYYQQKAYEKINQTVPEAYRQEAYEQANQEIDAAYQKAIDTYNLKDTSFTAQPVNVYANF